MGGLNHERVMSVLAEALELPAPRRRMFLDSTCAGEAELRREVEELLACADGAAAAFDEASHRIIQTDPQRIGPYEILEPVGEGGMAVVYKARQHEPVKRFVAIKLIKLGMDTRQIVSRFAAERQTLAMMDHPNVAQVHDAGATDSGRPYFVMEYVPGEPVLAWCDARRLPIEQRLEMFISICDAVEHAHRKGIIHRDLKSSNVLVTEVNGRALPKVIDFGIAKAISQTSSNRSVFTEQGQFIGTPGYMSPEQAQRGALDIDTRADVYSLGVLLYELLAGVHPIALDRVRGSSSEQVLQLIRETEPPRPSVRLAALPGEDVATIAERRAVSAPGLARQLGNELEWVPMKAMRNDREERYRGAGELADDIRNYLARRPLIAGPESGIYRMSKFLRRHQAGVAAAAAVLLALIGGVIATSWQAVRATRAEARASVERDNAQATLEFLTERVLSGATLEKIPDAKIRDQIVNAMIAPAAESVGESFKDRPLAEATIRDAIQMVLRDIGHSERALPHAEAALAIRRRLLGDDHPDTMQSLHNYGRVLRAAGRFAAAEPVYYEAWTRRRRVLGETQDDTLSSLNNYALVVESQGRAAEAEPLLRQTLELRRRKHGNDHLDSIMSLNNYAHVLKSLGRYDQAEVFIRETLDRRRRVQGPEHPLSMLALNNLADVLISLDRAGEAEPLSREALELYRRVYGLDHPNTMTAQSNYAVTLGSLNRDAEAEPLLRQVLEHRRKTLGDDHPDTLWSMTQLAVSLQAIGRSSEAEPLVRESWQRSQRLRGENHPATFMALNNYTAILVSLQRAAEAEPLQRDALARAKLSPSLGPQHQQTKAMASVYVGILHALGRDTDAAAVRGEFGLQASATRPTAHPSTHPT